ncbi:hypothetical protein OGATHE_001751, partial [Ogataea polymorpha]
GARVFSGDFWINLRNSISSANEYSTAGAAQSFLLCRVEYSLSEVVQNSTRLDLVAGKFEKT